MAYCEHKTIVRAAKGATSTCLNCGIDIIHNGEKWVWLMGMDKTKAAKLRKIYTVDRMTGAHK